jgi:hypothetical protein
MFVGLEVQKAKTALTMLGPGRLCRPVLCFPYRSRVLIRISKIGTAERHVFAPCLLKVWDDAIDGSKARSRDQELQL